MFIRFDRMCERDRHTDRQTYRHTDTAWWLRPRLHSIARQKSRFSTNISLWDDCWSVERCQHISTVEYFDNSKRLLRLCQSTVMRFMPKRTEVNLFVHINLKPKKKTNNALELLNFWTTDTITITICLLKQATTCMPAIHYFVRVTVVYLSNNNAQKN